MAELHYISVKGFRSIKSIDKLALRPINLLVGANGSGKSNFVGVFAFLNAIRQGKLVDYTDKKGGADRILHFGAKETKAIEVEISFRNGVGYHLNLAPADDDRFYVAEEWCSFDSPQGKRHRYSFPEKAGASAKEARISSMQSRTAARFVSERLESWRLYHFNDTSDTSPMKKTADVDDCEFLRSDGANLAAFLYFLRGIEPYRSDFQRIRKIVQGVAPFFDDFKLAPLARNASKIKLAWTHKTTDRYFDASALSDGTLRFICLATLFLQPAKFRPSIILVDEPELGLHPYAIAMLASMIKAAAKETQVIVSTQSPLLLDHFEPEDVLVADRANGETNLRRLASKDLAKWLDDYSLGQLWEKNQFGGRPGRG